MHCDVQIRASSLSGECGVLDEMMRGRFSISFALRDCAKRRAILSLEGNPNCKGFAAQAVEQAFQKCYNDYMPFTKEDIKKE